MVTKDPAAHWDNVYSTKAPTEVSWFESAPQTSLRLIRSAASMGAVIDVGAGASELADALLDRAYTVTVLDVSTEALRLVRSRLADQITYVVADVVSWEPTTTYSVWHDRAVFHFLTDPEDRRRYIETASRSISVGGALVLGTFAEDGPTACSALPTARYSSADLAELFGEDFALEAAEREEHLTPSGTIQPFTWVVLRRES